MFISPMQLEGIENPFNSPSYIFEPKMDGHRLIISKTGNETRLWTRHKTECTRQYPELWDVPIDGDVVLDGEVCAIDPKTNSMDVELVMDRIQLKKHDKIRIAANHHPVQAFIFDVLFYKGKDTRNLPLMKRKSLLQSILKPNGFYSTVVHIDNNGEDLYRDICECKMEGIVAKKKDSKYVSRQSHDWLKIVRYEQAEVFLSGYMKERLGWLAAIEENGKKRAAGIIDSGITSAQRDAFYLVAKQLEIKEDNNFVYIEPLIKAKVKIKNWTKHGMLRTPVFVDFDYKYMNKHFLTNA